MPEFKKKCAVTRGCRETQTLQPSRCTSMLGNCIATRLAGFDRLLAVTIDWLVDVCCSAGAPCVRAGPTPWHEQNHVCCCIASSLYCCSACFPSIHAGATPCLMILYCSTFLLYCCAAFFPCVSIRPTPCVMLLYCFSVLYCCTAGVPCVRAGPD